MIGKASDRLLLLFRGSLEVSHPFADVFFQEEKVFVGGDENVDMLSGTSCSSCSFTSGDPPSLHAVGPADESSH